jgi:hypothetical protein
VRSPASPEDERELLITRQPRATERIKRRSIPAASRVDLFSSPRAPSTLRSPSLLVCFSGVVDKRGERCMWFARSRDTPQSIGVGKLPCSLIVLPSAWSSRLLAPRLRNTPGKPALLLYVFFSTRSILCLRELSVVCVFYCVLVVLVRSGYMLTVVPSKEEYKEMRSVAPAVRMRPVLSPSVPPCTATVASRSRMSTISGAGSSSLVSSTSSRAALRSGYATAAAAAGSGTLDPFNGRPDPFANRPPPIANKRATPQEKVETYIRDDFHLKPLEVVTNEVRTWALQHPSCSDQLPAAVRSEAIRSALSPPRHLRGGLARLARSQVRRLYGPALLW